MFFGVTDGGMEKLNVAEPGSGSSCAQDCPQVVFVSSVTNLDYTILEGYILCECG